MQNLIELLSVKYFEFHLLIVIGITFLMATYHINKEGK